MSAGGFGGIIVHLAVVGAGTNHASARVLGATQGP